MTASDAASDENAVKMKFSWVNVSLVYVCSSFLDVWTPRGLLKIRLIHLGNQKSNHADIIVIIAYLACCGL